MGKKQKKQDLETGLNNHYNRWGYLREHGGSDPFYADGTNMNLVRNHILYCKNKMVEEYGSDYEKYPDIFYRDIPPEAEDGYMAKSWEIRDKAVEALEMYLSDRNFAYLIAHENMLDKKEKDSVHLKNVLNYVSGLADAIKNGDLIIMRRHAYGAEKYQESLAACAGKVQEIVKKKQEKNVKAKKERR